MGRGGSLGSQAHRHAPAGPVLPIPAAWMWARPSDPGETGSRRPGGGPGGPGDGDARSEARAYLLW